MKMQLSNEEVSEALAEYFQKKYSVLFEKGKNYNLAIRCGEISGNVYHTIEMIEVK